MNRPLSDKQQRFIHEYLIDQNARQAALRAGYSPSTQGGAAADLMKDPRIQVAICERLEALFEKFDLTAERLMMERARVAFFDPGRMLDAEGKPIPLKDLDPEVRRALTISYDLKNGEVAVIRVRPPNRNPALAALEKMLTLYEGLRREAEEAEEVAPPVEVEPPARPVATSRDRAAAAPLAAVAAQVPAPVAAPAVNPDRPMRSIRNLTLEGKPLPGHPADQEFIWVPDDRPLAVRTPQPARLPAPGLLKGAAKRVQQVFGRAA